jgi:hypothetical protein
VARGNEKGHVESLVRYYRRNFLVPVPSFESFAELNVYLRRRCEEELDRTVRGHTESKRQRLEVDRAAMLPFPKTTFESRKLTHAKANSLSLVCFDRNDYSVLTAYAHQDVVVIGGVETIKIVAQEHLVATHPRSWEKPRPSMNPCTTWLCSSESPAPSMRRGPSRTGNCRRASGRCAAASRSTWGPAV